MLQYALIGHRIHRVTRSVPQLPAHGCLYDLYCSETSGNLLFYRCCRCFWQTDKLMAFVCVCLNATFPTCIRGRLEFAATFKDVYHFRLIYPSSAIMFPIKVSHTAHLPKQMRHTKCRAHERCNEVHRPDCVHIACCVCGWQCGVFRCLLDCANAPTTVQRPRAVGLSPKFRSPQNAPLVKQKHQLHL